MIGVEAHLLISPSIGCNNNYFIGVERSSANNKVLLSFFMYLFSSFDEITVMVPNGSIF